MSDIQNLWNGTGIAMPANASDGTDGAAILRLANGDKLRLQAPPPAITGASVPRNLVAQAADALNTLAEKTFSATTNQNLSDQGRRAALEQPQNTAIFTMGQLWVSLETFRRSVDVREAKLYAVEVPNLAQAGAAIRAAECRTYYFRLDKSQRLEVLKKIVAAPDTVSELVQALLNSPFALVDNESVMLTQAWQAARRAGNVTEAEAIDADRLAGDWAAGQLGVIAAMVRQLAATWGKPDIAAKFGAQKIADTGYQVFGLTERDLAKARRTMPA